MNESLKDNDYIVPGAEAKHGLYMDTPTVSSSLPSSALFPLIEVMILTALTFVVYNHSGNSDFLLTAQRAATYFLDHIPSDGIVPW